jgi:hypothetical protein
VWAALAPFNVKVQTFDVVIIFSKNLQLFTRSLLYNMKQYGGNTKFVFSFQFEAGNSVTWNKTRTVATD